MISVVISCYIVDGEVPKLLKRCVASLREYDEIVIYSHKGGFGFAESWNLAAELAHGDYLIFIGCTNILISGSLSDLCVPDTVTSPLVNGNSQEFWGFVFCMPRNIYEKHGLYDMVYNEGSHMEDEDLWNRLKSNNVMLKSISTVNFSHEIDGKSISKTPSVNDRISKNRNIFNERWK